MRSVLAYTAARLLLFAVAFAVLYLLGARGLLAAAIAVVVSGLVSYVLLSGRRDAMSSVVADGIDRMRGVRARLDAGAAKEDEVQESASPRAGAPSPQGDAGPQEPAEAAEAPETGGAPEAAAPSAQERRSAPPEAASGGDGEENPRSGAPREAR